MNIHSRGVEVEIILGSLDESVHNFLGGEMVCETYEKRCSAFSRRDYVAYEANHPPRLVRLYCWIREDADGSTTEWKFCRPALTSHIINHN